MRGYISRSAAAVLATLAMGVGVVLWPTSAAGHYQAPGPVSEDPVASRQEPPDGSQTAEQKPPSALDKALPEVSGDLSGEQIDALRLVDEILREQHVLLSGESFVYRSEGRRDPFRSLLLMRQRELSAPVQRPVGLPGFLINEVTLKAVAQYQGRWHAMIVGVDQRTYFAEVGSELYDGRIVEINTSEVVFEQEVEDLLGARSTRRVVKRLRGDEG